MAGWSVPGVVHLREMREDSVGRRVAARHRITRRPIAVTYLSDELLTDTEFRARFAHEFERLARVRDARVSRVHRYVECSRGAAIVSDYVPGTPLRALLLAQGAVGTEAALVVLKDSLRGLAACHSTDLAHGDIKPESAILTRAGCVRLVDVGLSTSYGRRLLARSTPFYLAPEQWNARSATPEGDVYAATAMFFECLIGAPPFYADSVTELSAKHEQSTPPIDVIPQPARELVLCGLAKDPRCRPEARRLLAHVDDVAAHTVGTGWEQRGRRELARLLAGRSALPEVSLPACRRGSASRERQPVRLTAVVGGALVLAAGLASPPLAVIARDGLDWPKSPVREFPDAVHGTSPVRTVTNGAPADRAPQIVVPAVKTDPAARPLAKAEPNQALPSAPSVAVANPQSALEARGGSSAGSVQRGGNGVAQSQSAPAPGSVETTSGTTPAHVPGSAQIPGSVELPGSVQLPASIELPAVVHERARLAEEIRTLQDARTQIQSYSQGHEQVDQAVDLPGRHRAQE